MDPIRLDRLLVDRGLVASRPRAERLITDHGVRVDGVEIRKAGKKVRPDATLDLLGEDLPWVSRGALKLVAALDHFRLDPTAVWSWTSAPPPAASPRSASHRGAALRPCRGRGHRPARARPSRRPTGRRPPADPPEGPARGPARPAPRCGGHRPVLHFAGPRLAPAPELGRTTRLGRGPDQAPVRSRTPAPRAQRHRARPGHPPQGPLPLHGPSRCGEGFPCADPIDSPIEGGSGNREFLLHFSWGGRG